MTNYNPKNERIKRAYFLYQGEARGKAQGTIDAIRASLDRFERYTGHKDFAGFNKEVAVAFKKHLAKLRGARSSDPMAGSTMVATTNALRDFFQWLSGQPGYRARLVGSDAAFLTLSENERRAFREPKLKNFPTLEQVNAAICAMPIATEVEKRNRAALVIAILSGARDSALASLRLKHVDLVRRLILQDPREVRTKRRKRIDTFLFPLSRELENVFDEWVRYLREVRLWGEDAPLLPRTRVIRSEEGAFVADGVEPIAWENTQPLRKIFQAAFEAIGLPYFRPHSFRDTLSQFGERFAPSIEHYKAWSQNLGHEHITTTLTSYGNMDPWRQGELVRSMAGVANKDSNAEANRLLFEQFVRMVKSQGSDPKG